MNYTIYRPTKARKAQKRIVEGMIATALTALAIIVYGVFFVIL